MMPLRSDEADHEIQEILGTTQADRDFRLLQLGVRRQGQQNELLGQIKQAVTSLDASSGRLTRLTWALVGLTVVLALLTAVLAWDAIFK